jgi:citrate lyase gamma subunit
MTQAPQDVRLLDSDGDRLDISSSGGVTVTDDGTFENDISDVTTGGVGSQTDNLAVDVNAQSGSALDVSGATVTVTDNGSFSVNELQDVNTGGAQTNNLLVDIAAQSASALDVSAATVTVTDDGAFDVNSIDDITTGGAGSQTNDLAVDVNGQSGAALDVSAATVTVTDDGNFDATVTQSSFGNLLADADLYVGGSAVSSSNPVPIVEEGVLGTDDAGQQTAAAVSPGTTSTLTFQPSASVTATVRKATISAEVPFRAEVQKVDSGGTPTTIAQLHGRSNTSVDWEPKVANASLFQQAVNGTQDEQFDVVVENKEPSVGNTADVDVTLEWSEE